ncbi:MAG: hypothetical protein HKN23_18010, partial [Verrucomicrobiales bacterium]|nr:hypothetical protein [Verrucomicrobiales bacterium]
MTIPSLEGLGRTTVFSGILVSTLLFTTSLLQGEDSDVAAEARKVSSDKEVVFEGPSGMDFRTHAILGASVGEEDAYGHLEFLHPLWSDENSLLFLYPRLGISSDVDAGFSMGAGMRHYLPGLDAIFGYNLHYDRYEGSRGDYYDQLGLGLEVMSRRIDARFNYYIPEGDSNVVDSVTSSQTRTAIDYGDPFGRHYSILQPVTTTRTTTTRTFEQFEKAMRGYDWEVGVLVPGVDEYVDLRLFIGSYGYDNPYGEDLNGVKARAELRLSSKLAVDATYYEDEEVRGDNWVFGMRMNIPIYPENLENGGNPFDGSFDGLFDGVRGGGGRGGKNPVASARKIGSSASYITANDRFNPLSKIVAGASSAGVWDRMTEEIIRDPYIKTTLSNYIENRDLLDIDRIITKDIVVIDGSVVFVDSTRGPGGNGTFENPFNMIQSGVNAAAALFGNNGDVVVHGSPAYTEDVVDAGAGVKVWGGGVGVPALGGRRFRFGGTPTLNGGFDFDDIPHALISGFNINGGFAGGDGINFDDIGDVVIANNVINSPGDDAIDIQSDVSTNIRVVNNVAVGGPGSTWGNHGIEIDVDNDGGGSTVLVSGNVVTGFGEEGLDLTVDLDSGATFMGTIVNNQFLSNGVSGGGGGAEVDVDINDGGVANLAIRNNLFQANTGDGLDLDVDAGDGSRSQT